jgi:DNA polymerase III sliding clamp (beta) subunit (PCNA family)
MTAVVNADLFRIVYSCVSTEETRYYLNGVHVEPHPVKGAILVATDGHRMLIAHDKDGSCSGPIIVQMPRFALAQCRAP